MLAYQLKITLKGIRPAIWRRVVLPGNVNLARLHNVIQDAMGWEYSHLHEFTVGRVHFGPTPEDDLFGTPVEDEKRYTLERLCEAKDRFTYVYDMGDGWTHDILIEKVTEATGTIAPRCIAGARACPPEDCGGVWGYADLVEALADPGHERHEERREWVGAEWAPEAFDVDAADRLVARHRPQQGRGRGTSRSRTRAVRG